MTGDVVALSDAVLRGCVERAIHVPRDALNGPVAYANFACNFQDVLYRMMARSLVALIAPATVRAKRRMAIKLPGRGLKCLLFSLLYVLP